MRLFTGLSIPPPIQQNLTTLLDHLRPTASLKWSPVENLHVTVKFIGDWSETRLPELHAALSKLPKPGNIPIEISRFGFFPNPHQPHSLFAGVHAGQALTTLAQSVDEATAALGCPAEKRPYTAHLTLARIKDEDIRRLREHIASMTNFQFGFFEATHFHLYRSQPGPAGSVYTILETYPLTPGASV